MAAVALTIAGSDSSGGAGIQADLATFGAFGVHGASAITALTAQNTRGVQGVLVTPPDFIARQIDAVATDLKIGAVKTGMLATRDAVLVVCDRLLAHALGPLVVDPVMVATSGDNLLDGDAIDAVRQRLIPLAHLITPNLHEAAVLLGEPIARSPLEMKGQAERLQNQFGARHVLIKGGHGEGVAAVDVLQAGTQTIELSLPRLEVASTHGTGCTLSAAITALLAFGVELPEAVRRAKSYVWQAMAAAQRRQIGDGAQPLDHHYAQRRHGLPE